MSDDEDGEDELTYNTFDWVEQGFSLGVLIAFQSNILIF
jgi:hypothetical protein